MDDNTIEGEIHKFSELDLGVSQYTGIDNNCDIKIMIMNDLKTFGLTSHNKHLN